MDCYTNYSSRYRYLCYIISKPITISKHYLFSCLYIVDIHITFLENITDFYIKFPGRCHRLDSLNPSENRTILYLNKIALATVRTYPRECRDRLLNRVTFFLFLFFKLFCVHPYNRIRCMN